MTPQRKTWIQRKIAHLKEKRRQVRAQKIYDTVQQIKDAVAHGRPLTPRVLAWLEKFDKESVVPIKVLDISNQIKKNHEPSAETLAWLKEFDKESIVPAGFRDLNVYTEWRWVWDDYPLNQFKIALKFAPQQDKLKDVVKGLHHLISIPVSDYRERERKPFREEFGPQIFEIITGHPFELKKGYGVSTFAENETREHFLKFIYRCMYAYESVSEDKRQAFDRAIAPDVKKGKVVASDFLQQQR
ncbi:MAG: hypothetical protein II942_01470 [Alphaproteobacteria bacterium]|nr:hypothetical protein [Alphaproteobacteria bacterium]